MYKVLYITLVLIFTNSVFSQMNMQEGFKMLETGKFANAERFFKNVLETEPNNKTAKLCYGRAMGLNGQPENASKLFSEMLLKYPSDYELKLNYGESLLWNKKYSEASTYYQALVTEDSKSFAANLGLANSYSNLKDYPKALEYIDKALSIEPKNENAKISKKYILLGYGFELSQKNQYRESYQMLDKIFELNPYDEQAIWTYSNVATTAKDYQKSIDILNKLPNSTENQLKITNHKALIKHLTNHDKTAFQLSLENYVHPARNTSPQIMKMVDERYVQACIWSHKFDKAAYGVAQAKQNYPTEIFPLSLDATLGMYLSDFNRATQSYKSILNRDSNSFDGNLGIANAYFAQGDFKNAYSYGQKSSSLYPFQNDIRSFNRKFEMKFSPEIFSKISYSKDLGNDEAFTYNVKFKLPVSTKFAFLVGGIRRETRNQPIGTFATLNNGDVGFAWDITPQIQFSTLGRYIHTLTSDNRSIGNIMANSRCILKPNPFHNIELGFSQELQDFNTALIQKNIRMDHYLVNYNLSTLKNIGFFGQYYFTHFSDLNSRNLLFTSLYYTLKAVPVVKAGLNYQHIAFSQSKPIDYFSPSYFNLGEVFLQFIKEDNSSLRNQWLAEFTAAIGNQFIENKDAQSAYRLYGELGAKLNYQWQITGYGMYNNIASATAAGFKYTEIGLKVKYNFNHKIFKINP